MQLPKNDIQLLADDVDRRVNLLEVRLRDFIDHRLAAVVGPHYWKQTMPGDVIATVGQLITEHLSRHPYEDQLRFAPDRRRLDFCDVSHYEKIILKNWDQFEEFFRRKEEFQRHIAAYRTLRNCVHHNRPPSDIEQQLGQTALTWLERILDRYKQETLAPSEEDEGELTTTVEVNPGPAALQMEIQEEEPTTRQLRHKKFWTQLLKRAQEKTSLHARRSPPTDGWLNTGAGRSGLVYRYVILNDNAHIELRIRRDTFEESKRIFDSLQKNKDTIERAFGDRLEWLRRDDADDVRNCHIRYVISLGGLRDRDRWPEIQDQMIDAMIRLERALKPEIQRLK